MDNTQNIGAATYVLHMLLIIVVCDRQTTSTIIVSYSFFFDRSIILLPRYMQGGIFGITKTRCCRMFGKYELATAPVVL